MRNVLNYQMSFSYEVFMNKIYPESDHKDVLEFLLHVESGVKFPGVKVHDVFNKTKEGLLRALIELRKWPGVPKVELFKLEDMALNATSGADLYRVAAIGLELLR